VIVAVAGMHRSGTSMFASYLHAVGISMGEELYVDRTTNPYGHYEDLDFLGLQRRELARACGGEDYLVTRDFRPSAEFLAGSRRLLEARRARHPDTPWGWKDPRTTLFLDTWRELIADLRVVAMLRPPRLVTSSLCARLGAYHSVPRMRLFLRTYTHYNRALLAHLERHPRHVSIVSVERLIADPERVLGGLGEALGHPCPVEPFRATYDPEVMSKVRPAILWLNRGALREAEAVHAALLEHSL
jgi:hypothetical protein